jgi:hypothetical protein
VADEEMSLSLQIIQEVSIAHVVNANLDLSTGTLCLGVSSQCATLLKQQPELLLKVQLLYASSAVVT